MCPRGSYPFYIVSYWQKWVTTSWTDSTYKLTNLTIFNSVRSSKCIAKVNWKLMNKINLATSGIRHTGGSLNILERAIGIQRGLRCGIMARPYFLNLIEKLIDYFLELNVGFNSILNRYCFRAHVIIYLPHRIVSV